MNQYPSFTFMNISDALLTSYVLANQDVYPIVMTEYVIFNFFTF